jgi:hypothetical protein
MFYFEHAYQVKEVNQVQEPLSSIPRPRVTETGKGQLCKTR